MIDECDEVTGQGVCGAQLGTQALERGLIGGVCRMVAQRTNRLERLGIIAIQGIARDTGAAAQRRDAGVWTGASSALGGGLCERRLNPRRDRPFSVRHGG